MSKLDFMVAKRHPVYPHRPTIVGIRCSLSCIVIDFHALVTHGALGLDIWLDIFTASVHSLTASIWHQASTIPGSTTGVNHFEQVKIYKNSWFHGSFLAVLKLNCKLDLVLFLIKWLPFDPHPTKWFILLNALIFDNYGWEMIAQGKSFVNKHIWYFQYIGPTNAINSYLI